jgi:DNA-binding transcriptional LysR family regulator
MHEAEMLDWDDLRFFLAVARHRTLAAAARHLQVTQTTVSRRLTSLQAKMGVRLLQRTSDGYGLTLAGESIRPHVERLEAEAILVERTVAGHDMRPDGLVRVTGSQLLTSHVLAPGFALLHARHQGILIESLPDLPDEPLVTRDAEIALRLRRFDHPDLVVRSIGNVAFGLYGSVSYLARYGEPDLESGSPGHLFVAPLDSRNLASQTAWLTENAARAHVVLRADSYETQHWTVSVGGGLAMLPRFRADAEPALQRIETPTPIPSAEIWLGVHSENRHLPRVRIVLDCIAEAARARAAILNPVEPIAMRA